MCLLKYTSLSHRKECLCNTSAQLLCTTLHIRFRAQLCNCGGNLTKKYTVKLMSCSHGSSALLAFENIMCAWEIMKTIDFVLVLTGPVVFTVLELSATLSVWTVALAAPIDAHIIVTLIFLQVLACSVGAVRNCYCDCEWSQWYLPAVGYCGLNLRAPPVFGTTGAI